MDASSFVLSGDFGYVVLVMIFSVFMLMWMGGKVGGARKKYEVPVSYTIIILHFNRHDSHLDYILIQNTKLSWQPLCYWPQFPVSSVAWILIYFKICLKSIQCTWHSQTLHGSWHCCAWASKWNLSIKLCAFKHVEQQHILIHVLFW